VKKRENHRNCQSKSSKGIPRKLKSQMNSEIQKLTVNVKKNGEREITNYSQLSEISFEDVNSQNIKNSAGSEKYRPIKEEVENKIKVTKIEFNKEVNNKKLSSGFKNKLEEKCDSKNTNPSKNKGIVIINLISPSSSQDNHESTHDEEINVKEVKETELEPRTDFVLDVSFGRIGEYIHLNVMEDKKENERNDLNNLADFPQGENQLENFLTNEEIEMWQDLDNIIENIKLIYPNSKYTQDDPQLLFNIICGLDFNYDLIFEFLDDPDNFKSKINFLNIIYFFFIYYFR